MKWEHNLQLNQRHKLDQYKPIKYLSQLINIYKLILLLFVQILPSFILLYILSFHVIQLTH